MTIKLREVGNGQPSKDTSSVAYNASGKTLASGSNDAMIRLWDVSNGKKR